MTQYTFDPPNFNEPEPKAGGDSGERPPNQGVPHNGTSSETTQNRQSEGLGTTSEASRSKPRPAGSGDASSHGAGVRHGDLTACIPGLYRVLDLIHEQGSGGLVDKIIIEQDSLGRLINELRPSAYTSITKVDFSALDDVDVRPIGVYGSKSAIVDFLRRKEALDPQQAEAMLHAVGHSHGGERPSLRSGMYVLTHSSESTLYVVYWPEDTTWDDNAASSVRRNRITFMRHQFQLRQIIFPR
ncbi:hypothetical protein C8Q76DRAFT_691676 [Earliella scabrosa]|nr:hypothetical protein C8Q76DRAFT_691676 [Earliella scabrosa]